MALASGDDHHELVEAFARHADASSAEGIVNKVFFGQQFVSRDPTMNKTADFLDVDLMSISVNAIDVFHI